MSNGVPLVYEFDAFRLDPAERQLLRDGVPVALTPKVFETLVVLVERGGHLVEKEELLKLVWAEAFVEEANLTSVSAKRMRRRECTRKPSMSTRRRSAFTVR